MNNKKAIIVLVLFVVILGTFLFRSQIKTGFGVLYGLVFQRDIKLASQEKKGTLNVLLMGIGGGTHEGPDLTDTIILANMDLDKKRVNLISLPRDLWVPEIHAKINTAYVSGKEKNNRGIELAKAVVQKVTGQKPDYAVIVDFDGFVKTVDLLGGVTVDVNRTLDDYSYPIEGKEEDTCGHPDDEIKQFVASGPAEMDQWDYFSCRYKHIHVDAGQQKMDGQQASEFSRSRHGVGAEGSDFARSQRQQEVIKAVKSQVLSLGLLLNPVKLFNIYNVVKENVYTDIPNSEYDDFIKIAKDMQNAQINSYVVELDGKNPGSYGLLDSPAPSVEYRYAYVLAPRTGNGNFSEIQQYVSCVVAGNVCQIGAQGIIVNPTPTATPSGKLKVR